MQRLSQLVTQNRHVVGSISMIVPCRTVVVTTRLYIPLLLSSTSQFPLSSLPWSCVRSMSSTSSPPMGSTTPSVRISSGALDNRRKQLLYRSRQRGILHIAIS
jgi:hypothetical protein